jgi:NTE family protein
MSIIRNAVFSGAGVDGAGHVGATKQLQKELGGTLNDLQRVAGASSGAIMAMLAALNCTAEEIETLYLQINFKKIADGHNVIHEAKNIYAQDSIYDGAELRKTIAELLIKKHGSPHLTFSALTKHGYKDLHVAATIIGERFGAGTTEPKIFNAELTPDTDVLTAVLASASVPGLFPPIFMKEIQPGQFIEIKNPDPKDDDVFMYADGGYTLNLPERLFDKKKYLSTSRGDANGNEDFFNHETIGFLICPSQEAKHQNKMKPIRHHHPIQYALALVSGAIVSAQESAFLHSKDPSRTVLISNNDISAFDFDITLVEKKALIKNGESAAAIFFHPASKEEKLSVAEQFAQKRRHIPSPIDSQKLTQPLLHAEHSDEARKAKCCVVM